MPVTELLNDACNAGGDPEATAEIFARAIRARGNRTPGFYLFRVVWVSPTNVADTFSVLGRQHPDLDFQVLDPRSFFALFKKSRQR